MSKPSFHQALKLKVEKIDPIKKQRVIAHKQAGMSVPDICKHLDLEILVVSSILYEHISTVKLFGKKKK